MKTIDKINDEIIKYNKGEYKTIDDLFGVYKRLTGYAFFLGQVVAKDNYNYNIAVYSRKVVQAQTFNNYKNNINKKITDSIARNMTTDETAEFLKKEADKGYIADLSKLSLNQCNRVIDAIRSEISYLKGEKEFTKS